MNAKIKVLAPAFFNVSRKSFAPLALLSAIAVLPVATANAQQAVPAPAALAPAVLAPADPMAMAAAPASFAQAVAVAPLYIASAGTEPTLGVSSSLELPEDPGFISSPETNQDQASVAPRNATTARPIAKLYTKYIPAGWGAQHLTAHDKIMLGVRDTYSPFNFSAMILSAGYEQVLNGEPNYGVDRGAFGERLGAAAIRETTQGLFTDAVFAPLLHEDPRYYVEGDSYGFIHRVVYAGTRPLLTRTDSGATSVNGALLLGYAASSALSYSYYPAINQNFHDTAATFGSALGGAALGFVVSEFSSDVWTMLHLQKKAN